MSNPLFEEQVRAGFINFYMIRLHLVGLAIITFMVFLFYPSQEISYFLARSVKPEMFNIAIYTILTFLSYLTIKAAVFSIQDTKVISIKDWFLYTKISVGTYLWGRISYGLFYTFFLLLLFLPIILVSGSVSAISPENLIAIILMIYMFIINLYMLGLLFFTFFKKQHWILTLIIWFAVLIILFLSPSLFPEAHPTLLLLKLQNSKDLYSDLYYPVILSLSSLSTLILLSWVSVFIYSRSFHESKG